MLFSQSRCHRKKTNTMDMGEVMEDMMESKVFKAIAVGALVYVGAKTISRMMD